MVSATVKPSFLARLASGLVRSYVLHAPIERGKWWLRRKAEPWLVAPLGPTIWVRVSGAAEHEWSIFLGRDDSKSAVGAAIRALLKPGQVYVDVGANVGCTALTAARAVGPRGRVVAFEPGPAAAARLRENVTLNGLRNIEVVEAAVADRPGSLDLHIGEDSEGSSLYEVPTGGPRRVARVEVVTLDGLASTSGLRRVDLLKIDAEGAEVRVLRGARGLLSGSLAPAVIVEANPLTLEAGGDSLEALRAELNSLGYRSITVLGETAWRGVAVQDWLASKTRVEPVA